MAKAKDALEMDPPDRPDMVDTRVSTLAAQQSKTDSFRNKWQTIVQSGQFECVSSCAILAYAVSVGMEVELTATDPSLNPHFFNANITFCALFVLELIIRLLAWRHRFFYMSGCGWNWLDLVSVLFSFVEIIVEVEMYGAGKSNVKGKKNTTLLRMFRVLKTLRALRLMRLMRAFRELRILVTSVILSCRSLIWALLLIFLVKYLFIVLFTQAAIEHLKHASANNEHTRLMRKYFGSMWRTSLTMYSSMFGGADWVEWIIMFGESGPQLLVVAYMVFIAITIVAMLNVVTGVFVQNSIDSSQQEINEVIHSEIASETSVMQKLRLLFNEADTDNDGTLSMEDFCTYLKDVRVRAYLRHLGLDVSKVRGFFCLLDLDNSKALSCDEFVLGCLRLQGQAKSVDIATLMYEQKRLTGWIRKNFNALGIDLRSINQLLVDLERSGRREIREGLTRRESRDSFLQRNDSAHSSSTSLPDPAESGALFGFGERQTRSSFGEAQSQVGIAEESESSHLQL